MIPQPVLYAKYIIIWPEGESDHRLAELQVLKVKKYAGNKMNVYCSVDGELDFELVLNKTIWQGLWKEKWITYTRSGHPVTHIFQ